MQRYILRHRIILKKVTFNVTFLVTVFKSDEKRDDKCDDSIFLNMVSYSIMRYGTARFGKNYCIKNIFDRKYCIKNILISFLVYFFFQAFKFYLF